jgi:hypothetical protein
VTASGDVADAGTRTTLLDLPNVPSGTRWHMGGALHFGPDGKLYVAVGDHETGYGADDPGTSPPQSKNSVFGKILRLNADGSIPTDNPFYGQTSGINRAIYAMGLRNPFTFAVKGDGKLFISDVGQSNWEEVNVASGGGKNFGWPVTEGSFNTGSYPGFVPPAHSYGHGSGCSVVGATFYTGAGFPAAYQGKFFFADFCNGKIFSMDPTSNAVTQFASGISYPVTVDAGADGSLYYIARNQKTGTPTAGAAKVVRVVYTGSGAPQISQQPEGLLVTAGQPATFTIAANNASSYQWERHNGTAWAAISGATTTSYTLATTGAGDDGARFRCKVTNAAGTTTSSEAVLTVTSNQPPVAIIQAPASGGGTVATAGWEVGDVINFSGTGTDAEDGTLPASAVAWQVDFHHDTHVHPFMSATTGITGGSFTIPVTEADAALIWYRIYLTVTDAAGRATTSHRDIRPATFLSDMTWVSAYNGWGPSDGVPEKDMSIGGSGSGDGNPIKLDGLVYPKGLGMHPGSSRSAEAVYDLAGACGGKLIADVGIDDEVADSNTQASVTFEVWLDGVKAWDSGLMYANTFRKPVAVSVAGKNQLRLVVTNGGVNGNNTDHADWANARVTGCGGGSPPPPAQSAHPAGTPWPVPGTIQAEDYDRGGEGLAFHDTTAGNNGNLHRSDDVDIQASGDGGGGYNIGWTAAGEWLEYTVAVATAGTYDVGLRVAATAARTMHVEVDGVAQGGTLAIPNTGAYQTYTTVVTAVSLAAGEHVVRVVFDSGSVNFNWISFTAQGGGPGNAYLYFEAEGGAGASTAPMTVVNDASASGGQCIWSGTTGSNAAVPANGRVSFAFTAPAAGSYKIWGRFLVGPATTSDDSLWIRVDGGAWTNWNDIHTRVGNSGYAWDAEHDDGNGDALVTRTLSAGSHTLEVAYRENGLKLDRFLITNDLTFVP